MKIFMPVSKYSFVSDEVLFSIRIQGFEPEIIDCTFDPIIPKRKRIILSKTRCKEKGLLYRDDFTVIHDSDLVELQTDNFLLMQKFLENNPEFGAVSLRRVGMYAKELIYDAKTKNHICSGCIMFSLKGLEAVNFDDGIGRMPTCFEIANSLSLAGLKYGYLDNIQRIQTLIKENK
jgi:hypothetical protein